MPQPFIADRSEPAPRVQQSAAAQTFPVRRPPAKHSLLAHGRDTLALWHLLSLDAPTVAALWTVFFAASIHRRLPFAVPASMFLAVWLLYVADRLLDTRALITLAPKHQPAPQTAALPAGLEARHYFHHRHRRPLLVLLCLCAAALATLLPRLDPAAIRVDLLLGSLLFAYFVLIHATGSAHRLPKEISVGLFFSAAVAIPTLALQPSAATRLVPLALTFAVLCSVNCLFIYRWEHVRPPAASSLPEPQPHPLTRAALRMLTQVAAALTLTAVLLSKLLQEPAMLAVALSAELLLLLDQARLHLEPLTLRAAADLVLLTPLLLLLLPHTR